MSTKLPHIDNTWMFDLVSDDPRIRGVALARNDIANDAYLAAWHDDDEVLARINGLVQFGQDVPAGLLARADQTGRAKREAADATLTGLAARFAYVRGAEDLAPYAALFLTLENRYPDTWEGENGGTPPWHLKKNVLRRFAGMDAIPDGCRDMLVEAVLDAVFRLQRCEDRHYPALARRVDSPELRAELAEAYASEDVVAASRAAYTLWALENPSAPVTLASWRDWLVSGL